VFYVSDANAPFLLVCVGVVELPDTFVRRCLPVPCRLQVGYAPSAFRSGFFLLGAMNRGISAGLTERIIVVSLEPEHQQTHGERFLLARF